MSRPPDGSIRTNRVTPRSCTQIEVTWAPMSTMASSPLESRSRPSSPVPTALITANGVRSMPCGSSLAARAASTRALTIGLCAATRRIRTIRRPPWSISPSGSKSSTASSEAIGMNSWTWKPRVSRSSFSGSQGRATSRTTTRWFPTPRWTCLLLTPDLDHSSRSASATASGWRTSPASTTPGGSGTWAARTTTGMSPAATSATRTAVEPTSTPILVLATTRPPPGRTGPRGRRLRPTRGSGSSCPPAGRAGRRS